MLVFQIVRFISMATLKVENIIRVVIVVIAKRTKKQEAIICSVTQANIQES